MQFVGLCRRRHAFDNGRSPWRAAYIAGAYVWAGAGGIPRHRECAGAAQRSIEDADTRGKAYAGIWRLHVLHQRPGCFRADADGLGGHRPTRCRVDRAADGGGRPSDRVCAGVSGRIDLGATGQAQRARPYRVTETIVAGVFRRTMLDGHLIDRLLVARALTPGQHEAAEKVLALHDAAGFEPLQVASYAPFGFGSGAGHDGDQVERHDITRFRQLLRHAGDAEALALHGMALGDPPSARRWLFSAACWTAWLTVGFLGRSEAARCGHYADIKIVSAFALAPKSLFLLVPARGIEPRTY